MARIEQTLKNMGIPVFAKFDQDVYKRQELYFAEIREPQNILEKKLLLSSVVEAH